jgi:glycosyltransferase involved in cell wall biosynthesis
MKPFTIVVPVYNEEEILAKNVETLLRYSDALKVPYEIIIISNGSTDSSVKIGLGLQQKFSRVKFFSLPEKGVGRAFKKGILESKYDHIIFMDADLSADLSFIEKANNLLDKYVLVLGAKIKGLQNRGLFRKFGSFVFYMSVLALMGLKYVDYAPGAKGYQKGFLLKYFNYIDDHTSFVLNLTFIAAVKHEPIVEIAIACDDRRKSRFNLWHEAWSKYRGLFNLKLRKVFGNL